MCTGYYETVVLDLFCESSLLSASACSAWSSVENNAFLNSKKVKALHFLFLIVNLLDRMYGSWFCSLLNCYNVVTISSDHHLCPVPDQHFHQLISV